MAEDVVSRLLAHLDKVEQQAEAARAVIGSGWRPAGPYVLRGQQGAVVYSGPEEAVAHLAGADPAVVLRLVRAHRAIAEQCQQYHEAYLALIRQDSPSDLLVIQVRSWWEASRVAVQLLAVGYGLEEDQT